MAQIILPAPPIQESTRVHINIHIQADVIAAETIRRRANVWLLENIGNLLRAETPELILGAPLIWRLMIVLTSPTQGMLGWLGYLEVEATTGEILTNKDHLLQEVLPRAQALTTN